MPERVLNVTEARNQLPTLVKEVAENKGEIVITNRNEPKAIIMGYEAFQRQRRLSIEGARLVVDDLVKEVQSLVQMTQEGCRGSGEPELYLFLVEFEKLMQKIWEATEEISPAHAAIASELLDASRLYLAGEDRLSPAQLEPLAVVLRKLTERQLTMADAAEADRHLLAHGINALFPVHGDLASLYETETSSAG